MRLFLNYYNCAILCDCPVKLHRIILSNYSSLIMFQSKTYNYSFTASASCEMLYFLVVNHVNALSSIYEKIICLHCYFWEDSRALAG